MPKSPERIEFLTDVYTTALEGGIGYWSVCSYYRYSDEQRAVITEVGDGDLFVEHTITLDTIARGINAIMKGGVINEDMTRRIAHNSRTNGNPETTDYIDAFDADAIVQAGLFNGEVKYG